MDPLNYVLFVAIGFFILSYAVYRIVYYHRYKMAKKEMANVIKACSYTSPEKIPMIKTKKVR